MKSLAIALLILAALASSCSHLSSSVIRARTGATLTEDERHRLYSAALAASETPLESELFKNVCRKIGIFDDDGKPNNDYMAFVARHVEWAMKPENKQFTSQIDSIEKARGYLTQHLPN